MKDFLRKAFVLANRAGHSITNSFDYIGYLGMRAVMDSQFLAINTASIPSPQIRTVAGLYEFARQKAQTVAINQMEMKIASGDVGPKPDIKPALSRVAGILIQNAPRLLASHSAVTALTIGAGLVAVHLLTHGQMAHMLTDSVNAWMAINPNSQGPDRPNLG